MIHRKPGLETVTPLCLYFQVVAKLTADNLVFMMKLKQAEQQLRATIAERDTFKLAVEENKGPWFDEVKQK